MLHARRYLVHRNMTLAAFFGLPLKSGIGRAQQVLREEFYAGLSGANSEGRLLMRNLSTMLVAGAVALAPAAFADSSKEITVALEYDSSLLSSDAGAAQVLASLEAQADRACLRSRTLLVTERIDEACATDVVAKAIAEIHSKESAGAAPLAGIFATEPAMILAALEQR